MKHNDIAFGEVREEIRKYLKNLRTLAQTKNKKEADALKKVIFTEPRKGFINQQYVSRLVLFLRGTGCSLARETGGCTFCGFYNATNFGVKVAHEDYIAQIKAVIDDPKVNFEEYQIICLYNDGSMLREEEISFETLLKIIEMLNGRENIKKIVIESRVEDITEAKLLQLKKATAKEIEIAVGFESASPLTRDLCINKNFENSVFESRVVIAEENRIRIIPLLILKPPFLTEYEAVHDYINSLKYLEQFNFNRIDMELPTVEKYTLVYDLWINQMYTPAKLWSVIEILKIKHRFGLRTPIYISPPNYSVSAVVKAANCPKCDEMIFDAFEKYNRYGDVSVFDGIDCSCKQEWTELYRVELGSKDLLEQVDKTMRKLIHIQKQKGGGHNEYIAPHDGTMVG